MRRKTLQPNLAATLLVLSTRKAAIKAAASRLYGGIHFAFDNEDGLASGRCIGQTILESVSFRTHSNRN